MLQLGFLKLLGGSPLYEQAREFKIKAQERAPYEVISTAWLSARELVRLKEIEKMLSIYYNRGGFASTLAFLLAGPGASPFKLYEKLADFITDTAFSTGSARRRISTAFCVPSARKRCRRRAGKSLCRSRCRPGRNLRCRRGQALSQTGLGDSLGHAVWQLCALAGRAGGKEKTWI